MSVTVRYPVHRLIQNPSLRILITGYNERFARRFGRQTRNLAIGRIPLADDKGAADEWETTAGGGVMTRGVGSPPTGSGFSLIVIDDPIRRREDAESENFREKVWDWYSDDLFTRQEPGCAIVLCLTRWHHDDIAARALASEPDAWTILSFPAVALEDDPLGRKPGQALWPERYDEKALERIKGVITREHGLASWEALYQQNPTPREGLFFKVDQLKIVDALPANLRCVRAWDLAASQGKGDFTAAVKIGVNGDGLWYVTDVQRGQWATDERDRRMRQLAALDDCRVRLAQDPGQAGVDQIKALTRMLAGWPVTSERASGSKELRADAFSSQVNAGNVRLLKGDWNKEYIEELRTFPAGKHDDVVDASADSFSELSRPGARSGRTAGYY